MHFSQFMALKCLQRRYFSYFILHFSCCILYLSLFQDTNYVQDNITVVCVLSRQTTCLSQQTLLCFPAFIRIIPLQWTDRCTRVDIPVHYSARICSLECNDRDVLLKTGQTHYIYYYILICYFFSILLVINILLFVYVDYFSYLYKIF